MDNKPKEKFLVLDAFRGICACFVALTHFSPNSYWNGTPFDENAWLFVDFFFVLSGFIIYYNYSDLLISINSCWRFCVNRVARIYPIHLFTLLVFVSFGLFHNLLEYFFDGSFGGMKGNWEIYSLDITFIYNLLLLHSIGVQEIGTDNFNKPSWSVSVEFYTYMIFMIFIFLFRKSFPWIALLVSFSAGIFVYLMSDNFMATTLDFGLYRCFFGFFAGCFVGFLYIIYNSHNYNKKRYGSLIEIL